MQTLTRTPPLAAEMRLLSFSRVYLRQKDITITMVVCPPQDRMTQGNVLLGGSGLNDVIPVRYPIYLFLYLLRSISRASSERKVPVGRAYSAGPDLCHLAVYGNRLGW